MIVASGAQYRKLPLEGWDAFEGAGIYYAATDIEARACAAQPVAVVGGANSAGQAAIFLADAGSQVHPSSEAKSSTPACLDTWSNA